MVFNMPCITWPSLECNIMLHRSNILDIDIVQKYSVSSFLLLDSDELHGTTANAQSFADLATLQPFRPTLSWFITSPPLRSLLYSLD